MARVFFVIFLTTVIIGCAPEESPQLRLAEENKAIVESIYEMFMADDWEGLADYFEPDFVDHNPEPGQGPGFEGLRNMFREIRNGFPEFNIDVGHIIAEGEYVSTRVVFSGTHDGEYHGMPPTGNDVSIEGYEIIRLVDGKVVERWGLFDTFDFLIQVGVIEPPAM